MSSHVDYSAIGWEQFEDLCTSLWFSEGYTNIQPYGRTKEGGRDAIYKDSDSEELIIFQYKRWTADYSTSQLKSMIRDAVNKVTKYNPTRFILNSAQPPNATVNDWVTDINEDVDFKVSYCDRSWIDIRLDNQRQDLRRRFFGIGVDYHTWESLIKESHNQVKNYIQSLSQVYNSTLYVERDAKNIVEDFFHSPKKCLAIVSKSGTGKTNFICSLAEELISESKLSVILNARTSFNDENTLERMLATECNYAPGDFKYALDHITSLVHDNANFGLIIIDGLSEADNLSVAVNSVLKLIASLGESPEIKILLSSRGLDWPQIEHQIPKDKFFPVQNFGKEENKLFALPLGNFDDEEVEKALEVYSQEYKVEFEASHDAKEQLRNPLLLRIFFEVNKGQNIGNISNIPISSTFEEYINKKMVSVISKLSFPSTAFDIKKILIDLFGNAWRSKEWPNISHERLHEFCPNYLSLQNLHEIIHELINEGVLQTRERTLSYRKKIQFTFDGLQDYILLKSFLSGLPQPTQKAYEETGDPNAIVNYIVGLDPDRDLIKFASLIGIIIPEIPNRLSVLKSLLRWNFHAYSICLSYIPPYGNLFKCDKHTVSTIASQLRYWYSEYLNSYLNETKYMCDPWIYEYHTLENHKLIGIDLSASPRCREYSYEYKLKKSSEKRDVVNFSESYPTFQLSFTRDSESIQMHDPEGGIIMQHLRTSGVGGGVRRIVNLTTLPLFPGLSINVPERIALFDIKSEIIYMIKNNRIPIEPIYILSERARAVASSIPNLNKIIGLDDEAFSNLAPKIMEDLEKGTYAFSATKNKLSELNDLLRQMGEPISESLLSKPEEAKNIFYPKAESYSDAELVEYLKALFAHAYRAYHSIVEKNFPETAQAMNFYRQFPFLIIIIYNQNKLKYYIVPKEAPEDKFDIQVHKAIGDTKLDDPSLGLKIGDTPFNNYSTSRLSEFGKLIPPLQPIEITKPKEYFFAKTPIGDLVKDWLIHDLTNLIVV